MTKFDKGLVWVAVFAVLLTILIPLGIWLSSIARTPAVSPQRVTTQPAAVRGDLSVRVDAIENAMCENMTLHDVLERAGSYENGKGYWFLGGLVVVFLGAICLFTFVVFKGIANIIYAIRNQRPM